MMRPKLIQLILFLLLTLSTSLSNGLVLGFPEVSKLSTETHQQLATRTTLRSFLMKPDEGIPSVVLIDSPNEFAYLVVGPPYSVAGKIVKVRLSDLTRVGDLVLDSSFLVWAGVIYGDFAYLAESPNIHLVNPPWASRIVRISLSDLTYAGTLQLPSEDGLIIKDSAVVDATTGFAYFATDPNPRPTSNPNEFLPYEIVRINLKDFTRVGALTLDRSDGLVRAAVIDPSSGFAYFGTDRGDIGNIIRIRLSDFTRAGTLNLIFTQCASSVITEDCRNGPVIGAVIDTAHGFAYFATGTGGLIKIRLSDFTRVGRYTDIHGTVCSAYLQFRDSMAIDSQFIYGACGREVIRIRLSDFTFGGSLRIYGNPNVAVVSQDGQQVNFQGLVDFPGVGGRLIVDSIHAYLYALGVYLPDTGPEGSGILVQVPVDEISGNTEKIAIGHVNQPLSIKVDYPNQVGTGQLFSINVTFPIRRTDIEAGVGLTGNNVIMLFDSPSAEPLGCWGAVPTENGKATTSSGCSIYIMDFAKALENADEHIVFKMQAPSTPMSLTFNASVLVNSQGQDEGWSYTYYASRIVTILVGNPVDQYIVPTLLLGVGIVIGTLVAYLLVHRRRRLPFLVVGKVTSKSCISCGQQIENVARFCDRCGTRQP